MPVFSGYEPPPRLLAERRRLAEKQVREKFPGLIVGSSGWHRALDNRLRRIRL